VTFDDAVHELFRAPHASFVTERKRLAGELKAAGDKAGSTKLGKINRPPISAWAVNQLWWQERDAFDNLLSTAERLRDGDLGGTAAHRDALTALRAKASAILTAAEHSATESTLRRIQTTLSAIAATGNFDPDQPGALTDDRDPPGFEAAGIPGLAASVAAPKADDDDDDDKPSKREVSDDKRRAEAAAASAKAEAAAARRKTDEVKAKKLAERHRHEAALATAKGDVQRRQRDVDRLRSAVEDAEAQLAKAQAIAADLESKLAEMTDDDV
jgi:chemotaxis protein histidine kinase CheA